jgi:hypothetical protein
MKYWLNLYSYQTWQEFIENGAGITGFRDRRWKTVKRIQHGDLFLCYMTGISRFFAIEEVVGKPFQDDEPIWENATFPSRLPVEVILELSPEHAIPVTDLRDLSYFQNLKNPHAWTGHFRGSPKQIKQSDAEIIIEALEEAHDNPVHRSYDSKKLHRKSPIFETKSGTVSIPEEDDDEAQDDTLTTQIEVETSHEEIQWLLLYLGETMELDLWVANNDRGKTFSGKPFSEFSRLRTSLPVQFDQATNRTIELIDVLWLSGNSIVAAFEIEHSTAVYSGLLRMADLITMQPNIDIPLFIVAPDERRDKVTREINRPVFSKALKKPLPEICQFIPYSSLQEKFELAEKGGFLPHLKPDYLDEIAESVEIGDV